MYMGMSYRSQYIGFPCIPNRSHISYISSSSFRVYNHSNLGNPWDPPTTRPGATVPMATKDTTTNLGENRGTGDGKNLGSTWDNNYL